MDQNTKQNPEIVNAKFATPDAPYVALSSNGTANGILPTKASTALTSTPVKTPNASALQSSSPIIIPPTPVQTPTTSNLTIANNAVMGGVAADADYTPPSDQSQDKANAKDYLTKALGDASSQASDVNNIENDADLLAKKQKATAISTEMDQLDKQYRDQTAQIKLNTQGKLQGGVDSELNAAQDRYENNRANLALVYKVAAEDYQGAQDIVDHKVAALKDKNDQELKVYQLMMSSIDNDLTDSEKMTMQANLQAKQDKAKSIQDAYSSVLATAVQNKAPASILSAIDAASKAPGASQASIYAAAGNYGVDASKSLDDQYKKAQISKIYSDMNDASVSGDDPQLYTGLKPATAMAVRSQVSAFKTEPLVQNFGVVQEGRNFAGSLDDKTTNPADDQALIYSLAKALDPGSVVREGEYATAQKYSQSWIASYGKGVTQALAGTGFLSETARKNIKDTIEAKYQSSLRSYNTISDQYKQSINNLTGRDDGNKFIKDYTVAAKNSLGDPESQAKATVTDYGASNPNERSFITQMTTVSDPTLGRPLTYSEIQQYLQATGKL